MTLATSDAVACITLSRPPVNAIDEAWLASLDDAIDAVERASGVAALLIRSTEHAFCAGADLALMRSRYETAEGRARMVAFVREIQRVYARLERLGVVTIAEIGGAALGGGLELALACDLRIVADTARLGLPEARLGLIPGAGGTQRLTRIAGEAAAKRLILGVEVVTGDEAAALGVAQYVAPAAELATRARALADRIATLPPAAIAACKRCIALAIEERDEGYELELVATGELLASQETQNRVRRFLEGKR